VWKPIERTAARASIGIGTGARVAAWHGRLDAHRKGLDVLLDAWERVSGERPESELELLLVGTGYDADQIRDVLAAKKLTNVRWVNEHVVDQREICRYLSAADVYVFPSRGEGFPVAPMEAMACGLPVVGSDASGMPDLLGGEEGGGVIVPRGDAGALAAELGRLLDDPDLALRLGEEARRRAERSFSLDSVGPRLRDFLLPPTRPRE
jgi:glycosyltransferase involved in cell wall biosynthesis